MTKMMGVVSNDSLAEIAKRCGIDDTSLIPQQIGQQKAYGDTIKGGAIEACIGAMYAYHRVRGNIHLSTSIDGRRNRPLRSAKNYIGRLQEQYRKKERKYQSTGRYHGQVRHTSTFLRMAYTMMPVLLAKAPATPSPKPVRKQQNWHWKNSSPNNYYFSFAATVRLWSVSRDASLSPDVTVPADTIC